MEDLLLLLKYLFLGVFQGFTEPIPISSSGHLILLQHVIGVQFDGLSFELLVNFASLLAVLVIFRSDIWQFSLGAIEFIKTRNERHRTDFNYIVYIILATIPAVAIALLLGDFIGDNLKDVNVIAITLIITGVALWVIRNLRGRKNDAEVTTKDAIIIGFAQAIALIPGISRSGATIVAAMGLGLKQDAALKFSFLMYIPISIGGIVFAISEFISIPNIKDLLIPYTIAFIGSFFASYFSLKWFMGVMARGNLIIFSIYCFVVGTAILLFF